MHAVPVRRLLAVLLLALGLAGPGAALATTPADGPWHLRLELSSFFDGHIATVEHDLELSDGRWEGSIRQDRVLVGLRLAIAGAAVRGLLAVKPGGGWATVSIPFDAVVAGGRVERRLSATAILETGGEPDDRETRDVDVRFSLERR